MNEKKIMEEFRAMCRVSINPDLYSTLVDEIIPALKIARKGLGDKIFEPETDWARTVNRKLAQLEVRVKVSESTYWVRMIAKDMNLFTERITQIENQLSNRVTNPSVDSLLVENKRLASELAKLQTGT